MAGLTLDGFIQGWFALSMTTDTNTRCIAVVTEMMAIRKEMDTIKRQGKELADYGKFDAWAERLDAACSHDGIHRVFSSNGGRYEERV
jgi:hypothetical protein